MTTTPGKLRFSHGSPGKLTLYTSPTSSNTRPVEKSLAEIVDTAFHPEARKRLVASLKKRENDHALELETLRESLAAREACSVAEVEERVLKAEKSHQRVLDQFAAYKINLADDLARQARVRDTAIAEREALRDASLALSQSEAFKAVEAQQQAAQAEAARQRAEVDELVSSHQEELAKLAKKMRSEFELQAAAQLAASEDASARAAALAYEARQAYATAELEAQAVDLKAQSERALRGLASRLAEENQADAEAQLGKLRSTLEISHEQAVQAAVASALEKERLKHASVLKDAREAADEEVQAIANLRASALLASAPSSPHALPSSSSSAPAPLSSSSSSSFVNGGSCGGGAGSGSGGGGESVNDGDVLGVGAAAVEKCWGNTPPPSSSFRSRKSGGGGGGGGGGSEDGSGGLRLQGAGESGGGESPGLDNAVVEGVTSASVGGLAWLVPTCFLLVAFVVLNPKTVEAWLLEAGELIGVWQARLAY